MERLNILLPVYNEEHRLERGIRLTECYFAECAWDDCELTIVDNASVDGTRDIALALCEEYPNLRYIHVGEKGVGVAFRHGVAENDAPIVGYMDIDLSTDLQHLQEVREAFERNPQLGMVNGSRWASTSKTEGRKWYRTLTSNGLTLLLRVMLGMQATDAICGFKFFRKGFVEKLIAEAGTEEDGWFYIIELLLRAERSDKDVLELPVHWEDEISDSKVAVIPLVKNYMQQIGKLRKRFKREGLAV